MTLLLEVSNFEITSSHSIFYEFSLSQRGNLNSSPYDLPFDVLDTDLLPSFLVIVKPLLFDEIDARK